MTLLLLVLVYDITKLDMTVIVTILIQLVANDNNIENTLERSREIAHFANIVCKHFLLQTFITELQKCFRKNNDL